jgi:RND family efflux transporter MFP subunit
MQTSDTEYGVSVETIQYDSSETTVAYIGLVKPHNEFTINARAEGVVSDIYLQEGDSVQQDDLLIDLKDGDGNNSNQINQDLALSNLKNAKNSLENSEKKVAQNIKAGELALSSLKASLLDAEVQLDKNKNQNTIIIKNSEDAQSNLRDKIDRLRSVVDLTNSMNGISDNNIVEASNISFENIYNGMELALFSTLPSTIWILKNTVDIPYGINGFENDVEDLQDDLDDIRGTDIDDFLALIEDSQDFLIDFYEYLNDEDVRAVTASTSATIQASLSAFGTQLQSYNTALINTKNSLNLLTVSSEIKKQNLDDQLVSLQEQLVLQTNAINLSKAQTNLAEYTIQANINNMKNQIKSAENNLELTKTMAKSEIDGLKHNIEVMEMSLKQANLNENYLEVKSNVEGVISQMLVEKGQLVYMRDPVAKVYSEKMKEVEIFIEPSDIGRIDIGSEVKVSMTKSSEVYSGEVVKINPTADERTHLVSTTIVLQDNSKKIVPNSVVSVDVVINHSASKDIYIPLKAVLIRGGRNYVFLEKNNKAFERDVEIGTVRGSKVEIISGLEIGEKVVTEGNRNLKNGYLLRVE